MEKPNPKLPLYLVDIDLDDEETGVVFNAVTNNPAIEKSAMMFSKQEPQRFKTVSDEKRIIMGPLMIPNLPIYRKDPDGTEYYVAFSKSSIEKIAVKFSQKGNWNNLNDEHDSKRVIKDVVLYSSFVTDKSLGISAPAAWSNLPDGTWFGAYKVMSDELWQRFKKKGDFGFSVEGVFLHKYISPKQVDEVETLRSEILSLTSLIERETFEQKIQRIRKGAFGN